MLVAAVFVVKYGHLIRQPADAEYRHYSHHHHHDLPAVMPNATVFSSDNIVNDIKRNRNTAMTMVVQLNTQISQGNAATDLRRGGRSRQNATVRGRLKSVHICQSYR